MTPEHLAGQLLWCGWGRQPGDAPLTYDDHARQLIEEVGVGGLILFPHNLGSPAEIAALTDTLRGHASLPPLFGIDQEGGRVCRLPLPGMTFPGNMALGAIDNPERTRAVACAIGEQLAALGIDVDFAPTLDVNNNPLNPIIGIRAFSEDAQAVARHGIAAIAGFEEAGVLPVIKHFPGHGDTHADSHLELPVQPADRARLEAVELVPFRAALAAGAPAVMTTHILFPALDPELPATLSPTILKGLLREELGFDGLIVTDCLEMRGIALRWSPEEIAVGAIEAGVDMLLVCHTRETQLRMHRALCDALRRGRLSEERLWESARRVQAVRDRTAPLRNRAREPERVSAEQYQALEEAVTLEAVTLLDGTPLPRWNRSQPICVSGTADTAAGLARALREEGFQAEELAWSENEVHRLATAPQLLWVVLPNDPFPGGQPSQPLRDMLAQHPAALVVPVREHYCLEYYPANVARLTAWGGLRLHLRALARWLAERI